MEKRFDFLRDENVNKLDEEGIHELFKMAEKKLEERAAEYKARYGSVVINGEEYVFITDIIDWDDDWDDGETAPFRRAICVNDGINTESSGLDNIFGWVPLYDIWFDGDGNVADYDQQLIYNVFTDEDFF